MLFVFSELMPVLGVLTEVDLVDSPKALHLGLVHVVDVRVLDRKQDEAVGVFLEEGLVDGGIT